MALAAIWGQAKAALRGGVGLILVRGVLVVVAFEVAKELLKHVIAYGLTFLPFGDTAAPLFSTAVDALFDLIDSVVAVIGATSDLLENVVETAADKVVVQAVMASAATFVVDWLVLTLRLALAAFIVVLVVRVLRRVGIGA